MWAPPLLAALFLAPSVTLLFALAVVPVSWLFLAAVPLALGVALVIHPVAVTSGWWRRGIPLRALGWVALSFVVLTVAAGVISAVPAWAGFLVVAASGLFNARAWVGMVGAVVEPRHPERVVPAVPIALAVMAAVVAVGSVNGFTHVNPRDTPDAGLSYTASHPRPTRRARGQRLRLALERRTAAPGAGAVLRAAVLLPGPRATRSTTLVCERRHRAAAGRARRQDGGPGGGPAPRQRPRRRHRGRERGCPGGQDLPRFPPARHRSDTAVLASPLLGPGRVSYPVGTSQPGFGLPSADAMQLLGSLYKSVAPIDLSPDSAFLKSVDQLAPLLKNVLSCPTPGIRQFAFLPLADATAAPARTTLPFPSVVVPAFHGGLVGSPSTGGTIAAALEGRIPAPSGVLRDVDNVVSASASAWQVPALPLSDYARAAPGGGSLAPSCRALAVALRS